MSPHALPAPITSTGQVNADKSLAFSIRYGQSDNPFVSRSIQKHRGPTCRADAFFCNKFSPQPAQSQKFAHSLPRNTWGGYSVGATASEDPLFPATRHSPLATRHSPLATRRAFPFSFFACYLPSRWQLTSSGCFQRRCHCSRNGTSQHMTRDREIGCP